MTCLATRSPTGPDKDNFDEGSTNEVQKNKYMLDEGVRGVNILRWL